MEVPSVLGRPDQEGLGTALPWRAESCPLLWEQLLPSFAMHSVSLSNAWRHVVQMPLGGINHFHVISPTTLLELAQAGTFW